MDINQKSLEKHLANKGKIEVISKFGKLVTREDLSIAYTPGVAAVSTYVAQNPSEAVNYTIKGNTIAVVSDGSAVLGLGNIGPLGALPVMEGKALLFKEFADIDAYPIVLSTQDTEEIIKIVKGISPTFGGINLEDISAPRCFEIEERLKAELSIPVMHDDQHGTAIVVLAALINSLKLAGKKIDAIRVVIGGVGAAGTAVAKLLDLYGAREIIMVDSKGIVSGNREDLNPEKKRLLTFTNKENISGDLATAMAGSDVFIGVSAPNTVSGKMVSLMNEKSIVFAMANPTPEIMPDLAKEAGAFIVGTGRSDFPNQINNVLAFPGIFRGAIDNKVSQITDQMKIAAAEAISACVNESDLSPENVIPSVFDRKVVLAVAKAVKL
jgi:malate dehydrogenase (oxaloacetate-decarboxylating)